MTRQEVNSKYADKIMKAQKSWDLEKYDLLNILEDSSQPSGYRADIYWKAGTDSDCEVNIDLEDIFSYELNVEPEVISVINEYGQALLFDC